jgi:signal transduction histidine kinase
MLADTPHAHILIVDDEALHLRALCDTLSEEGFETTCCSDAEEALCHLRERAHDILLCDLRMPGLDGIALIQQAVRIDPDVVPVVLTGQGSIPSAVQAMQQGAVDYVLKPLRLDEMRPVLMRALELRRLRGEKRKLEQSIEKRTIELESANRELEAFAARIAHDLREPVNIVRGFARLLEERHPPQPEQADYLRYIIQAADRADRLVRDLLAFARLGDSPLVRQSVDLNNSVQHAREIVELADPQRPVDWIVDPLPTVQGDESLLQQVFVNLLSNALKYSAQRERSRIAVTYQLDAEAGHVISVADNGVGFNPEQAARLFMPFQRLHRQDQFEGNGMGLANVKRIVERHGGCVHAEPLPGEGARFSITLPMLNEEAAHVQAGAVTGGEQSAG